MAPDAEHDDVCRFPDFVPPEWVRRYGTGACPEPSRRGGGDDSWAVGLRCIGWLGVVAVSVAAIIWPVTGVAAAIAAVGLLWAAGAASSQLAQLVLGERVNYRPPGSAAGRPRPDRLP